MVASTGDKLRILFANVLKLISTSRQGAPSLWQYSSSLLPSLFRLSNFNDVYGDVVFYEEGSKMGIKQVAELFIFLLRISLSIDLFRIPCGVFCFNVYM